ncbi:MAG: ABC transporter ATP-binding protein [Oscillibacter sp.]|nr:ABC transporter ATP-binding protein [Oscillibacter sp.]
MRISVENLSFSYDERPVLQNVTFAAGEGEVLSVLGANGAGKSTLFRCLLGNLFGYTGSITVEGQDLRRLSPRKRAKKIAYIPQSHRPTFGYTVLDTALMGTTRHRSPFLSPGKEQEALAWEALARVGAEQLALRDFSCLSGGEQQLVLLARALAQQADILVMDEPASSLDYGNQLRVLQMARELAAEGYTVILSTHDPQQALRFSDRVLALAEGRVVALGEVGEVLTRDLLRRLYHVETEFYMTPKGAVILPEVRE